jgi:hypothetical protein
MEGIGNNTNDQHEVTNTARELAWDLPAKMLIRILCAGITDTLSIIGDVGGRQVTVEIVTPDHIVDECFDTLVRVLDERGQPWVEAILSLRSARALAALVALTETDLEQARGPIAVEARLSRNSLIEAAWEAIDLLGDGPRA